VIDEDISTIIEERKLTEAKNSMSLFPNELQRLTQRAMAKAVLEWLVSHPQFGVSNENRLSKQCQLVVNSKGIIQNSNRNWRIFVQSLKDVQEYWFIIQTLGDKLLRLPFLDVFRCSLDDSTHPIDSGEYTPGRDKQFELFLAAIAARAGLTVNRFGSTGADWIMTATSKSWSLEAKRIKNFNRLEKHIRKAAKQIATSKIGGIIAVDISLAANPKCSPLSRFVPDTEINEAHDVRTNALVREKLELVVEWIGSANVGFVLLHDFVIRPAKGSGAGQEPWGLIGLWSKMDLIASNSSNRKHYDDLWHLFQVALPNL
jgi:hypothetical protein